MPITIKYDAPGALVAGYAAGQNKADEKNRIRADRSVERRQEMELRERTRLQDHLWDQDRQNASFGQQGAMQDRTFGQQKALQENAFGQQQAMNDVDGQQRMQVLQERDRLHEQGWINEGMRLGEYTPADQQRLARLFDARSRASGDRRLDDEQRTKLFDDLNQQISEVGRRRMKAQKPSPEEDFQANTYEANGKRYSRTANGWTLIDGKAEKPEKPSASDLSQPENLQRARDRAERALWIRKKAKAEAAPKDSDEKYAPITVSPKEVDAELKRHGYKLPGEGDGQASSAQQGAAQQGSPAPAETPPKATEPSPAETMPTFRTPEEVRASQLPPGTYFRTPGGEVRVVPVAVPTDPDPFANPPKGPNGELVFAPGAQPEGQVPQQATLPSQDAAAARADASVASAGRPDRATIMRNIKLIQNEMWVIKNRGRGTPQEQKRWNDLLAESQKLNEDIKNSRG